MRPVSFPYEGTEMKEPLGWVDMLGANSAPASQPWALLWNPRYKFPQLCVLGQLKASQGPGVSGNIRARTLTENSPFKHVQ